MSIENKLNGYSAEKSIAAKIHSDEIYEIITKVPSRILQWGIPLLLAILLSIIGLSALINYPDSIKAVLKIEQVGKSSPVVTKVSARMERIFVTSGATVKKGDILAYLECNAKLDDVVLLSRSLKGTLQKLELGSKHSKIRLIQPFQLHLGDVQSKYDQLYQESLSKNGLKSTEFYQQLILLLNIIDSVNNTYTLIAPIDGKVAFTAILKKDLLLNSNQKVFSINSGEEQYNASIEVASFDIKKIHKGQTVLISLSDFPSSQYGKLRGKITDITDEPFKDNTFICGISIVEDSARTSLHIKKWMMGEAQIIIANASLFAKVYKSLCNTPG